MKKYILTAIFLGLLITLFYYPTPASILEQNNINIQETTTESQQIVADSDNQFDVDHNITIERDPNSESIILSLK